MAETAQECQESTHSGAFPDQNVEKAQSHPAVIQTPENAPSGAKKKIDRRSKEYRNRTVEGVQKLRPRKSPAPHNPRKVTKYYSTEKCSVVMQLKPDIAEWLTKTAKTNGIRRDDFIDQICREYKDRLVHIEARFRVPR